MRDAVYRQGVNKTAQVHRGLSAFYDSFFAFQRNPHPFQIFHGIEPGPAREIMQLGALDEEGVPFYEEFVPPGARRSKAIQAILSQARYYPRVRASGGRRSGKTIACVFKILNLSARYPNNLGIIIRGNWKNVETTLEAEMDELIMTVTDGHPEYLVRLTEKGKTIKRHVGFHEMVIFTKERPSKILLYPEPEEATDRALADAVKSPQGGAGFFYADEESELHKVTVSTLEDNLSRPGVPHVGLSSTNPFVRGMWGYDENRQYRKELREGQKPRVLVVDSSFMDNPYLEPDVRRNFVQKYKDDPEGWASIIEGKDIIQAHGVPCFKNEFNHRLHLNRDLRCNPHLPLFVGIDWGYNHPAAWFAQRDELDCWNTLGEIVGDGWYLDRFAREILQYLRRHYPSHAYDPGQVPVKDRKVKFWCDPAGNFENERGKTVEEFQSLGIHCKWSDDSRFPRKRVDVIRKLLTRNIGSRAQLQIHPRCEMVVQGFQSGWYYRQNRAGQVSEEPDKRSGFLHNLLDAGGYLFWGEVGPTGRSAKRKRMLVAKGPNQERLS